MARHDCSIKLRNMYPQKVGLIILCSAVFAISATPLDDYVWKNDGHYKYEVMDQWTSTPGIKTFILNMTSQKWLTEKDVNPSIWWHHLIVTIPDHCDPVLKKSAYLFITGGHNGAPGELPDPMDDDISFNRAMAASTGSVTAVLKQVPNQPTIFMGDPKNQSRTEDAIIAYTWRHFIDDPSDPMWLLRMAMTKAAVKGMDAVTDFVHKTTGVTIENFCVGGESKRGWTTWTTGAIDFERVKCITPIVMDELNMVKNLHHHFRAYGGWTFEMYDYYVQNVTQSLDDPNTQKMADIVDGYAYRDRLTMPKMIFCTGGDEFFLPDDSYYFFDDLKGPKYLNMAENTEHSGDGHNTRLFSNIRAFYVNTMSGYQLPTANWTLASSKTQGIINVTTSAPPAIIAGWQATTISTKRRDFRLYILGDDLQPEFQPVMWRQLGLKKTDDTHFSAEVAAPKNGGWTAFFIRMSFFGINGTLIEFTTETNIVPNTFPFEECSGESCLGILV